MLKYHVVKRKNMKDGGFQYHPALHPCQPINREQLYDEIAEQCTVTSADIKAVVDRLQLKIAEHLLEGKSIRLGDLGSFHLTLSSKGVPTKEEVTTTCIQRLRVRFTPSSAIYQKISIKNPRVKFLFDDNYVSKPKKED